MTPMSDIFAIRVVSCKHKGWKPGWWIGEGEGPGYELIYVQTPTIKTVWSKDEAEKAMVAITEGGTVFELVRFSAQPSLAG